MAWLGSRRIAVALAAVGLVAFFTRALLDWRFVYPKYIPEADVLIAAAAVAFYAVVAAVWIWGILHVAAGQRNGANVVVILSFVFLVLHGLATPLFFCSGSCTTAWPLFDVVNIAQLVLGVLAVGSAWLSRASD